MNSKSYKAINSTLSKALARQALKLKVQAELASRREEKLRETITLQSAALLQQSADLKEVREELRVVDNARDHHFKMRQRLSGDLMVAEDRLETQRETIADLERSQQAQNREVDRLKDKVNDLVAQRYALGENLATANQDRNHLRATICRNLRRRAEKAEAEVTEERGRYTALAAANDQLKQDLADTEEREAKAAADARGCRYFWGNDQEALREATHENAQLKAELEMREQQGRELANLVEERTRECNRIQQELKGVRDQAAASAKMDQARVDAQGKVIADYQARIRRVKDTMARVLRPGYVALEARRELLALLGDLGTITAGYVVSNDCANCFNARTGRYAHVPRVLTPHTQGQLETLKQERDFYVHQLHRLAGAAKVMLECGWKAASKDAARYQLTCCLRDVMTTLPDRPERQPDWIHASQVPLEMAALQGTVARLRAALESLVNAVPGHETWMKALDAARKALGKE